MHTTLVNAHFRVRDWRKLNQLSYSSDACWAAKNQYLVKCGYFQQWNDVPRGPSTHTHTQTQLIRTFLLGYLYTKCKITHTVGIQLLFIRLTFERLNDAVHKTLSVIVHFPCRMLNCCHSNNFRLFLSQFQWARENRVAYSCALIDVKVFQTFTVSFNSINISCPAFIYSSGLYSGHRIMWSMYQSRRVNQASAQCFLITHITLYFVIVSAYLSKSSNVQQPLPWAQPSSPIEIA